MRTVMQHAWAAVDHRIRYKADDLPRDLSRRLFRLNALLEIADEQFAGLQHASLDRSAEYADAVEHGDLGVTIDILSLRALVNREDIGPRWVRRAVALGYNQVDPDEGGGEALERLLRVVRGLNVARVADVAALLPDDPAVGDTVLRDVLASLSLRPGQARFWAFPGDVLALVILGLVGTPELVRGRTSGARSRTCCCSDSALEQRVQRPGVEDVRARRPAAARGVDGERHVLQPEGRVRVGRADDLHARRAARSRTCSPLRSSRGVRPLTSSATPCSSATS